MSTAPEIHLKAVSRHWGEQAVLKGIHLRFGAGERIALIGPSGAGKSTLIRLIAGALRPTAGSIEVNGQAMADFNWRALQHHRSMCRIVEQQNLLVPQASVHSNVVAGLLSTWPWHKALLAALMPVEVARVTALLQALGMDRFQWDKAGELSGGQMQRVAIARALIANPTLLLADEPTASLDPNTAKAVTRLIVEQAQSRSMSLVFCTHWFDIVRRDCTRVIGLRAGEVMFDCAPDQATDARLAQLYAGSDERI
jgi:phosphonate transport system ATP-binding protein